MQPNYSGTFNTAKNCTKYSQNICSVVDGQTEVKFEVVIQIKVMISLTLFFMLACYLSRCVQLFLRVCFCNLSKTSNPKYRLFITRGGYDIIIMVPGKIEIQGKIFLWDSLSQFSG